MLVDLPLQDMHDRRAIAVLVRGNDPAGRDREVAYPQVQIIDLAPTGQLDDGEGFLGRQVVLVIADVARLRQNLIRGTLAG